MNKIYQAGIMLSAGLLGLSSCSSWTETEAKNIETPAIVDQLRARDMKKWAEERELQKKEDESTAEYNAKVARMYEVYWQSVRDYKASEHPITYGWFGGWSATEGLSQSFLSNLPDSVDMVSIWGGTAPFAKDSDKAKDLKYAQEVKGLKVLLCWQNSDIGLGLQGGKQAVIDKVNSFTTEQKQERYGNNKYEIQNPTEVQMQVIEYALMLTDFIEEHGLDGYDIDYEPFYGPWRSGAFAITGNASGVGVENMKLFIRVMGKMYGPQSGRPGKIFAFDGELDTMAERFPEMGIYFDWFIDQAYDEKRPLYRSTRISSRIQGYQKTRHIFTDEFESQSGWSIGGRGSSAQDVANGTTVSEVKSQWVRENGFGGWGAYHIELESRANYKYVRKAIQTMNPANYRP